MPLAEKAECLEKVCLGNVPAMEFCFAFLKWCHWIDDTIDQDQNWQPDDVVRTNLEALVVFSDNGFFQRHKGAILPLIIQAFRAFADSNQWEGRGEVKDRRAADVLKSLYHEVFWHVGFLCAVEKNLDAWAHLTEITTRFRAFDYDCKE